MARKVTLQTIAEHLGVSRTTVSNAYNRPDQLAPELRERVLATAAELGYTGPGPRRAPPALRRPRGDRPAVHRVARLRVHATRAPCCSSRASSRATEEAGLALLLLPGYAGRAGTRAAAASAGGGARGRRRAASARTRCRRATRTSRPRSSAACRSWSSTSRARASTPSSASTTARARGWPPSTSPRSGTGGSASCPSGPPTTATPARSRPSARRPPPTPSPRARLAGWREGLEAAGIEWAGVAKEERILNARERGRRRPARAAGPRARPHGGAVLDRPDRARRARGRRARPAAPTSRSSASTTSPPRPRSGSRPSASRCWRRA